MSREFTFVSWNAENAFSDKDKKRAGAALEQVRRLEADVIYIPEFSEALDEVSLGLYTEMLEAEGYRLERDSYYDGVAPYGHRSHFMAVLARGDNVNIRPFSAGERKAMHVSVDGVEVAGIHHEDYRESDRRIAAAAVIGYFDQLTIKHDDDVPQIIMGDFNAIDPSDRSALPLRLVRPLTEWMRLRQGDRTDYYERSGIRHLASLGIRLADMSAGDTIGRYKAAGFRQSDQEYIPTIAFLRGGRPVFKIDHILSRGPIGNLEYSVHTTSVSDHALIQARAIID